MSFIFVIIIYNDFLKTIAFGLSHDCPGIIGDLFVCLGFWLAFDLFDDYPTYMMNKVLGCRNCYDSWIREF